MDTEELLKLLDLSGARAGPSAAPALVVSGDERAPTEADSPTALEVDDWGLRRGEELLATCARLRELGLDRFAAADCHAAAFDPEPRLTPSCRDRARRAFFAALFETPEYRSLHAATRLDATASEIAAVHFAEAFARSHCEAAVPAEREDREVATLRCALRAARAAADEVAELQGAAQALGMGPGLPGGADAKAIAELFRRVRNDPTLRSICELAGRYRRLAQSRQRRKSRHGLDDVVGVALGNDLSSVLPHELARLADPELAPEALRRLAERQMLTRERQSSEQVGKGPIVVCVDESGSMAGAPAHAAKAMALALAWIARRQRRWCALVAYSGDSGERLLALPPTHWNETALADWLVAFLGRGSTLDVPVRELPRMLADLNAPPGESDAVVITDCVCRIPSDVRDAFNAWKRASRTRTITLVLGDDAGDLRGVSDEVHVVRSLDVEEDAVGRALSV